MEEAAGTGKYKKYDEPANDLATSIQKAWEKVWNEQQTGELKHAFTHTITPIFPYYSKIQKCLYFPHNPIPPG